MTDFEKYFGGIISGEITACEKMKTVAKKLMNDFENPGKYHFDEALANKHIQFIERFCKQPTGKIGSPLKLELYQKARLQAVFGFVDDKGVRKYNECLIIEGRKNGKALSLDTDIPTPYGFKKMADVCVGDYVAGVDGRFHRVTCVSDIFKNHDCYSVTFRGGDSIICDASHIWTVKTKKGKITQKTTDELLHFSRKRKDGNGIEYLWRIPVCSAVQYSEKEQPIDAYTFGVWLGDGCSYDTRITVDDRDIEETSEHIKTHGHTVKVYNNKNRAKSIGIDVVGVGKENRLFTALKELGCIRNKHIPDVYMFGSVEQRLELLRGLMDTDGYCSKSGQCEFCQKDERLVDQVRELLASLGIISSKRKKQIECNGKMCEAFSVLFYCSKKNPCFYLKRKTERLKESLNKRMDWNSIIEIKKVESVPCKCISIDSEDHLYLAGRSYVVTHNTTECAAVELDMLVNDHEGSPQIYNVATMRDQATLGFNAAHKMVQQSPLLKKHIKKRASDLYFGKNMGFIKALASNANSLDGLDVHCGVIDELSAIKNRDIYDLVKQAMGARRQPLLFTISTNGFVRDGIFDSQYQYSVDILNGTADNEHFLPFIYELDDVNEWDKEDCWIKANPGLGTVKSVDYLRQMVQKAKDDPSFKPTVLTKDFNIKQTSESAWLRYEDLNNEEMIDQTFDYCIGGFDAADTTDLNAAVAIMMRPDDPKVYVKSMFWIPESVIQQMDASGNRRERDNVPYRLWIEQGYMRTCPGSKCEKRIFLEWFKELRDDYDLYTTFIGFDPWHVDDSLISEFKNEFGQNAMIPVRQGTATLSEPMKNLAADFTEHNVVYDNNPVLKWCLINTEVKTDVNGNIQPCKGRDRRNRIDGLAALLDAYVVLKNNFDKYINLNG